MKLVNKKKKKKKRIEHILIFVQIKIEWPRRVRNKWKETEQDSSIEGEI